MLYRCVKCGEIYKDNKVLIKGCKKCGGRFFILIKEDKDLNKTEDLINLPKDEQQKIEKSIKNIIGEKEPDEKVVILDPESIRISRSGRYDLDLVKLFKKDPLVLKTADGKYFIDLARALKQKSKTKSH